VLGLSIEEAIVFWNKSFSMTDEQFNKEHKYNIRHSYGLEGKRANYPAKRCAAQRRRKIRLTGLELRATTDMWAI
jgi:DNA primase large subunit